MSASEGDVIVAPHVRDLEELRQNLAGWVGRNVLGGALVRLDDFSYPFGAGRSHETILFDAVWADGDVERKQGMVVRIKPSHHLYYPDDLFVEQYHVMRLLHDQGRVKVAKPYALESDPAIVGAPFFVMERKYGRVAVSTPPYAQTGWVAEATPAQRLEISSNGVRQLAATQLTPMAALDFLVDPASKMSGLDQEWDRYVRHVEWATEDHRRPILNEALAELKRRWPVNQVEGLVWGDARLGNVMFDDSCDVVAVMDWEQPGVGGALHDLAWWLFMDKLNHGGIRPGQKPLEGMISREETIELWRETCGKSTEDFDWYEDFVALKVASHSVRTAVLMDQPIPDEAQLRQMLSIVRPWI